MWASICICVAFDSAVTKDFLYPSLIVVALEVNDDTVQQNLGHVLSLGF